MTQIVEDRVSVRVNPLMTSLFIFFFGLADGFIIRSLKDFGRFMDRARRELPTVKYFMWGSQHSLAVVCIGALTSLS